MVAPAVSPSPSTMTLMWFSAGQVGVAGQVDAVPQWRMRPLDRLEDHRHLVEMIVVAVKSQFLRAQALQQHLERLVVHRLGLAEVEAVGRGLVPISTRRGRRRAGSARRSFDRACRLPRSAAADGRTAADRPSVRNAACWCGRRARRTSPPARRRRQRGGVV